MSNSLLHNLVWKRYIEHPIIGEEAKKFNLNKGSNCLVTGYTGFDRLLNKDYIPLYDWKIKDRKVKRIIWAPHHTISNYTYVTYSTFLWYYEFMFEMAEKYKDQIQIVFKPHPLLKNRLNIEWGLDKTKEYYLKWKELPNGMVNDGAYEDLFLSSDAIIHDSGSFIAEYLVTGKPGMFLSNGLPLQDQYNELGEECLSNYYIGRNKEDIENFIKNIIVGVDPLKDKRIHFINTVLKPTNGKLASENIIDDLVKELLPK